MLESGVRYMQIELKDRVKRMTVFQTYVFDYYFWVNLDDMCPHTVTVYPNFSIFSGVNCRSQFGMRRVRSPLRCRGSQVPVGKN